MLAGSAILGEKLLNIGYFGHLPDMLRIGEDLFLLSLERKDILTFRNRTERFNKTDSAKKTQEEGWT